jgi:hypothetical protein
MSKTMRIVAYSEPDTVVRVDAPHFDHMVVFGPYPEGTASRVAREVLEALGDGYTVTARKIRPFHPDVIVEKVRVWEASQKVAA